jgi:hypothetical protein
MVERVSMKTPFEFLSVFKSFTMSGPFFETLITGLLSLSMILSLKNFVYIEFVVFANRLAPFCKIYPATIYQLVIKLSVTSSCISDTIKVADRINNEIGILNSSLPFMIKYM